MSKYFDEDSVLYYSDKDNGQMPMRIAKLRDMNNSKIVKCFAHFNRLPDFDLHFNKDGIYIVDNR